MLNNLITFPLYSSKRTSVRTTPICTNPTDRKKAKSFHHAYENHTLRAHVKRSGLLFQKGIGFINRSIGHFILTLK